PEPALVPAERRFHLPPLPIHAAVAGPARLLAEPLDHLPPVLRLGPFPAAPTAGPGGRGGAGGPAPAGRGGVGLPCRRRHPPGPDPNRRPATPGPARGGIAGSRCWGPG